MQVKEKIDLSRFVKDKDTDLVKSHIIDSSYIGYVDNFSAVLNNTKDSIVCPECRGGISSSFITKAGFTDASIQRFQCHNCLNKFSINYQSINWVYWFKALFSSHFKENYQLSSIIICTQEFIKKENIRYFNSRLRAYNKISTSVEYAIDKAFVDTLNKIFVFVRKKLEERERDNWTVIINTYNSERSYDLDFRIKMAENKGIKFATSQIKDNPLIHCKYCNGTSISKYGFSNANRRRFECKTCEKSFVLKGVHLFTHSYVEEQYRIILLRSNQLNGMTDTFLNGVVEELSNKFMLNKNLKRINALLAGTFLIHELWKLRVLERFAVKKILPYRINKTENIPSEIQSKEINKIFSLGKKVSTKLPVQ